MSTAPVPCYSTLVGEGTTQHKPIAFLIMCKIETLMNEAVLEALNWKSGNTEVVSEGKVSRVFLHGNQIATIGENFIQLFDGKHQTATTKSRLNAILFAHGIDGERVFQKAGKWFVDVNGGPIPFFSGMRLN